MDDKKIEFYKKYRFGNFKVQFVKLLINDKGESRELRQTERLSKDYLEKNHWEEINAVKVMTLEETWCVRFPQHYGAFAQIALGIGVTDEEEKENFELFLSNMLNSTCYCDVFFQSLLTTSLFACVYHNDEVSPKKKKRKQYEKVLKCFKDILEDDLAGYFPKEKTDLDDKEFHQMEIADKAREILK